MNKNEIKARLAYLRQEIEAERLSYGEQAELQSLAEYIDKGDVLLLQWAGVPEFEEMSEAEVIEAACEARAKRLKSAGVPEFKQCGSCEQIFKNLKDNSCPFCGSGNWVNGYIDEE
jgi:hypothetical protein